MNNLKEEAIKIIKQNIGLQKRDQFLKIKVDILSDLCYVSIGVWESSSPNKLYQQLKQLPGVNKVCLQII
jgi:hypothetical protein